MRLKRDTFSGEGEFEELYQAVDMRHLRRGVAA